MVGVSLRRAPEVTMTESDTTATPVPSQRVGKQLRKVVPRALHGGWDRRDEHRDPVHILQQQATTRVPELVPIRYARMLVSPFTFYRGAAAIMAADLAATPTTGLTVQLCGDAHLANFGGFSSPERALLFDLNDFDETLPGPFEWDLKRLVASFMVAGRYRGFSATKRRTFAVAVAESYRKAMREFAEMSRLQVWYARMDAVQLERRFGEMADAAARARLRKIVAKAQQRTGKAAFSRYTEAGPDGQLRPINQPPLVVPVEELYSPEELEVVRDVLRQAMNSYHDSLADDRRHLIDGYRAIGLARKVVGVGSVGTRCWIVLMVARDDPLDDLVMQVKEANASVLEPYLGASAYSNHGRRVVEGQRLMQAASDTLLGWQHIKRPDGEERDFYVRQMWDGKVSTDLDSLAARGFLTYAQMCGWTLARAHARSGDRKAIAGYLGGGVTFADALATFAEQYADQNEADYARLQQAAADGEVPVATERY
jgi:uncharacterized protein (DUF2252 family)